MHAPPRGGGAFTTRSWIGLGDARKRNNPLKLDKPAVPPHDTLCPVWINPA